jgi:protein SCO1/2
MIQIILAILFALAVTGCDGSQEQTARDVYQVRGLFEGLRFEGQAIRVQHEEIPGLMEAMSMDFKLSNPSEAEGLEPGDKITFRYIVTEDDSFIEDIAVLPPETQLELGGMKQKSP